MKYLALIKQLIFPIIIILLLLYGGYVIWSLYNTVYAPLVLTSNHTVTTSKQYRIPDNEISPVLETLRSTETQTAEIDMNVLSLGEPLRSQADDSVEVPAEILPELGTPD